METVSKLGGQASSEIVCSLSTPELRKRKATVVAGLVSKAVKIEEVEEGLQFKFDYSPELVLATAEFINLEKECCVFFNFNLMIPGWEK